MQNFISGPPPLLVIIALCTDISLYTTEPFLRFTLPPYCKNEISFTYNRQLNTFTRNDNYKKIRKGFFFNTVLHILTIPLCKDRRWLSQHINFQIPVTKNRQSNEDVYSEFPDIDYFPIKSVIFVFSYKFYFNVNNVLQF